ncbi:MAG: DJ-1/PfpI family protein [Alphaproteobacteria bacterium]|nr:DJ-1/PfpI family protein [Alphaproteobacteria bacterium]
MTVSITEKKTAIIAANGFEENHMTAIQRALTQVKLSYQVISPEQGLVNGWQSGAWGHYFPVDAPIGTVLGSDYDALILVGGERSISKLKQNLHVKRIVNHFMEADKPISAIGDGATLLALSEKVSGRKISADEETGLEIKSAGVVLSGEDLAQDGNMLTSSGEDVAAWADATVALVIEFDPAMEEAA